jgi:membrane-bound ClpP family serine protease
MRIDRLIRTLFAEPWLIEPRMLAGGVQLIHRRLLAGEPFHCADVHAELGVPMPEVAARRRSGAREPRLAVVPIVGIIDQRSSSLGPSAQAIERDFDLAVSSPEVDGILLDIDSPGGGVTGIPELAAKIRAARQVKPVLAIANGMAASGAYWLDWRLHASRR